MSPLVATPNRGYPDWQRINNYDSPVLWSVTTGSTIATTTSPVIDMSRWAYIGGQMFNIQNQCQVAVQWYADSGATVLLGSRQWVMDSNNIFRASLRLPNLGPFLIITVTHVGAANYNFKATIIGTNRVHPLEFIPANAVLIDQQATALGASATVVVHPFDYYAGPARLWFQCGQAATWQLQYINSSAVTDTIDEQVAIAANVVVSPIIVTPPGSWSIAVTNTTVNATTFNLAVTHSTTGAI